MKRVFKTAFAALFAAFVGIFSAQAADLSPTTITDFRGGLQTTQDPSVICDGCAQDIQNVDVWTGRAQKRRGSIKQNSTALTGDQPVRFLHEFPDSSNNIWLLQISSNSFWGSKNGGVTQQLLSSTHGITSSSDFSATNGFNKSWLTDGTTNWISFDGTTVASSTAPPKGKLNAFYKNRLFTAGVSGSLSTLYGSRLNDSLDWTDDNLEDDDAIEENIRNNDGYPIRVLFPFKNDLIVFKDFSIDRFTINPDGLTYTVTPVSNIIGCIHPKGVHIVENRLRFLGPDGFYEFDGVALRKLSEGIEPTVKDINQLVLGEKEWSITTQADWGNGTLEYNLSSTTTSGDLVLTSSDVIDTFADGNITSNPTWTHSGALGGLSTVTYSAGLKVTAGRTSSASDSAMASSTTFTTSFSTGIWQVGFSGVFGSTSGTHTMEINLYSAFSGPTDWVNVYLRQTQASGSNIGTLIIGFNGGTSDSESNVTTPFDGTQKTLRIERTRAGVFTAYFGTHSVTFTSVSSAYSAFNAVQVRSVIQPSVNATHQLDVTISSMVFAASGVLFQPTSFNIGSNIASFSIMTFADTTQGNGSISYALYMDTNSSIVLTDTNTFVSSQTITSGQVPTVATNTWAVMVPILSRGYPTETVSVQSMSLKWNEANVSPIVASLAYEKDSFWFVALSSTTGNDTGLVYDRNGAWTKYTGLPVYSATLYRNKPYFGSNLGGYVYRFQVDGVYSDDGAAINAYWISKEFDFGYPVSDKTMLRYYITAQRNTTSSLDFSYGVNRGSLTSQISPTESSLSLGSVSGFFRRSVVPFSITYSKGISHRVKFANSDVDEYFDILSLSLVPRLETAP